MSLSIDRKSGIAEQICQRLDRCLPKTTDLIQLHAPLFEGNEWAYVKDCLDTGWVSSVGKYVDRFEQQLAAYTGSQFCIATANGTLGLHVALLLLGVGAGDEVLIPDLTFVATANAVSYLGAIPHLVDVSEQTLGVDPVALRDYLSERTVRDSDGLVNRLTGRHIKALVVMHTFGHPAQLDEMLAVSEEFKLPLIEDAAESIGSLYKGKHTGRFGQIAVLSFNGNKTITTGGGGALLTDNSELAKRAKHLTTTAKVPHKWRFYHDCVGFNYRLPNINAALGCAQLEQLDRFIAMKRELAAQYRNAFDGMDGARFFIEPKDCRSNYWLNTLILEDKSGATLDEVLTVLNERQIQTRPAWDLMHTLPAFEHAPKMPTPVAEQLASSMLCIPSSPGLWQEK